MAASPPKTHRSKTLTATTFEIYVCVYWCVRLGDDLDDSTGLLDLLLGQLGDESSLDDERLVDSALAELGTWNEDTKEDDLISRV